MRSVVCVMLADGRHEMVARAVAAFHAQEHRDKQLLIWNTGERGDYCEYVDVNVAVAYSGRGPIGALRNKANNTASFLFPGECDVIAHWDSDDYSHPLRLTEQMAMLDRSRAEVVGYRECVFWDSTKAQIEVDPSLPGPDGTGCLGTVRSVGEAWTYRSMHPGMVIGSSMLYPLSTWEKRPFPEKHIGEDTMWLLQGKRSKVHAVTSISWAWGGPPIYWNFEPRMVCSIHGANTSSKIVPGAVEWTRAPRLDAYCRERMAIHATR